MNDTSGNNSRIAAAMRLRPRVRRAGLLTLPHVLLDPRERHPQHGVLRLAPGAVVLFHDSIHVRTSRIYGQDKAYKHRVKQLMDELKADRQWQVFDLPYGDGVTMVRLSRTIFVPARTAWRTSSSHTNSAARPEPEGAAGAGEGDPEPDGDGGTAIPREARNWSIRSPRTAGLNPARAGTGTVVVGREAGTDVVAPFAGLVSYASRLILRRCFGEMLSDVIFPPQPPQPRVIAGSSPVVIPTEPWVVGVLTTIRNAGFFRPNSRMI